MLDGNFSVIVKLYSSIFTELRFVTFLRDEYSNEIFPLLKQLFPIRVRINKFMQFLT
jgi:hypothetical protein